MRIVKLPFWITVFICGSVSACGGSEAVPGASESTLILPCLSSGDCDAFGADFVGYRCAGATEKAKGLCVPDNCGDGALDVGEECDDANDDSTDGCTAECAEARCGDGIVHEGVEACDDGNTDDADRTCTNTCTEPICGDGIHQVDLGEACDDGNEDDGDGCTGACELASCGDGIAQLGEACDDGNEINTDNCVNCLEARCGDGFTHEGEEECDDGNSLDTDACTTACRGAACGDFIIQPGQGETCDDGNDLDSDDCTTACARARCGDGYIHEGTESCDDGNIVETDACIGCRDARCGDGLVYEGREACDDGNTLDSDACTSACQVARCGDGITQAVNNEDCDDGNDEDRDACVDCRLGRCGDGIRQGVLGEECDDGNRNDSDACIECRRARCGDGVIRARVEDCDDGNLENTDDCTNACQSPRCGDGITWNGVENCDDGNRVDEDACTSACRLPACGDGITWNGVEACDDGNQIDEDECLTNCEFNVCGDGFVHEGEETCDDGNRIDEDACTNACQEARCGDGIRRLDIEGTREADYEFCDGENFCTDACIPRSDQLASGNYHTCALTYGTVKCWGSGAAGAVLGVGNGESIAPIPVELNFTHSSNPLMLLLPTHYDPVSLAGGLGARPCALVDDDESNLFCWGANQPTGVGNNLETKTVPGLLNAGLLKSVSSGARATCGVKEVNGGDYAYCWGLGTYGVLGNGNTANVGHMNGRVRTSSRGFLREVDQVSVGYGHACAVTSDNRIRCWGHGSYGQLGRGNTSNQSYANGLVSLHPNGSAMEDMTYVAAGWKHTCAIKGTGWFMAVLFDFDPSVYCWGQNDDGQLGAGDQIDSTRARAAGLYGAQDDEFAVELALGFNHTCAMTNTGSVWCWGANNYGQLGLGEGVDRRLRPTRVPGVPGRVVGITAGNYHTCVMLADQRVFCWGHGTAGSIGDGEMIHQYQPAQVEMP